MAKPIKIQELLKDIDYSFKNYIPSKEALMFANFIKEVNDGSEENETPLMHLYMMDKVFNKDPRVAIMVFRGSGKTSLFSEYLTLWKGAFGTIPGFGKVRSSLYITDSIDNGVKSLRRNVEFRYSNSDYLKWLIPNKKLSIMDADRKSYTLEQYDDIQKEGGGIRFTDARLEFENRKGDRFVMKGYGVLSGVRGTKEGGRRPDDATFDDLIQSSDVARSQIALQSINNTIYEDVLKALNPTRYKMTYLGTPFSQKDPLYVAVESGSWNTAVFPVAEDFDSTTTKENFVGAWEDRFSYEYVKDQYDLAISVGQPKSFYQELMLRVINEDDRLVLDSDIKWYRSTTMITDQKELYNFYITTDLATGSKESSDFSVISVWAYSKDKKWYWVDGVVAKQNVDVSFDDIFRLVKEYNPFFVSMERQGSQKGFISLIKKEMISRDIYFAIASDKKSGEEGFTALRDKISRFQLVLPYFKRGEILFPENLKNDQRMEEAIIELKSISNDGISSKHDDFIDTVSHIPLLTVFEPNEELNEERNREVKSKDDIFNPFETYKVEEEPEKKMNSYIV